MVAQQRNLDTIANNLANVNTTGFKAQRAEFQDVIYQSVRASGARAGGDAVQPTATQIGLGSQFASTGGDFKQGAFLSTNNPLDIAIGGDGFFKIEMPDGSSAYSRDGSFKIDSEGAIVTNDGYKLAGGIVVPPGATSVSIAKNGTVTAKVPGTDDPQDLGQIKLTLFPNPAGLTRAGQNLYLPGGASGTADEKDPGSDGAGYLQSGVLEGSNVEIVEEMVRMITAQRAYEINSKAIQTSDDMLSTLNQLKR